MEGLWHWLPLYITGFFAARIVALNGVAEALAHRTLKVAAGHFHRVLLALILLTTTLSFVVPNLLTVLAILPVLVTLRGLLVDVGARKLTTPLLLSVIYGANLGGLGSLIGSPANALMIGTLAYYERPEAESINFINWLVWGVPTALLLAVVGWLVIVATLVRRRAPRLPVPPPDDPDPPRRRASARFAVAALIAFFSLYLSGLGGYARDVVAASLCVVWTAALFLWRAPSAAGPRRPLIKLRDNVTGLPWRGLILAAIALAVSGTLVATGLSERMAIGLRDLLPEDPDPFWFYVAFALIAIMLTELVSNTATSLALFPLAHEMAVALGWNPTPAIIAVALASTLAFMSPIATPATGLAFGGLRGASLTRMIAVGAIMNVLCAFLIGLVLTIVLPAFYGFSVQL